MTDVVATLIGTFVSALISLAICLITQSKVQALLSYRLDKVEEKMDKHNNLIERVYKLEQRVEDIDKDL